ncbi:hypothetical protein NDU88_005908 [Pleurodeles waltl]|uniref:Uncharacterized protein n=1 Tax=Pleurodeles waltl TaxID=8319 RepID=A0AAV7X234_PLEWA|nr:hypothetical protein NDU88_005908 [Pleurodeles waltl]
MPHATPGEGFFTPQGQSTQTQVIQVPDRYWGELHHWIWRRDPQERMGCRYVKGREQSSLQSVRSGRHLAHAQLPPPYATLNMCGISQGFPMKCGQPQAFSD